MTKDAQAGRAYLHSALDLMEAAVNAGIKNPADLTAKLKLGGAVAEFLGKRSAPAAPVFDVPRFEKVLYDGVHVVTHDLTNGLEWDVCDFKGKEMTHDEAVEACKDNRALGHADWRLPTIQELLTLVDYERSDPAIDKEFFPNCKSSWYRTSTPYKPYSDCAWGVYFSNGYSGSLDRDYRGYVRAVRAS